MRADAWRRFWDLLRRLHGKVHVSVQALCDYVYLSRRQGILPEAMVTFRGLARLRDERLRHAELGNWMWRPRR